MGTRTHILQFPTPFTTTPLLNRTSSSSVCCFSARHGGRSGGSRWESRTGNDQQRFRFDEEFRANGNGKDAEFRYGGATKQRIWWSDDDSSWGDGYEDEDEDEDFEGFGALEGSIGFSSILKVLQAFGWMVPAVIISMLLGTGTNTIVMALAVPLAQSALSLIIDTFSGGRPRPKSRTKKRSAKTDTRTRGGNQNTKNWKGVRGYASWASPGDVSDEKEVRTEQSFGGWDELDNPGTSNQMPKTNPNETKQWSKGKLSRWISKKEETPLLLRLLIAVFPLLGSWTKLL